MKKIILTTLASITFLTSAMMHAQISEELFEVRFVVPQGKWLMYNVKTDKEIVFGQKSDTIVNRTSSIKSESIGMNYPTLIEIKAGDAFTRFGEPDESKLLYKGTYKPSGMERTIYVKNSIKQKDEKWIGIKAGFDYSPEL